MWMPYWMKVRLWIDTSGMLTKRISMNIKHNQKHAESSPESVIGKLSNISLVGPLCSLQLPKRIVTSMLISLVGRKLPPSLNLLVMKMNVQGNPMPIFNPTDLVGHTLLMDPQEDGERYRIKIIEALDKNEEQLSKHPNHIKFMCSVNDDMYKEIFTYNEILEYITKNEARDEDQAIIWMFKHIAGHQGPLKKGDPGYNGSKFNVLVEWETGESMYEPCNVIVERISLGSLRQSLRITVALSLILVLFSVGYGVPISQYVSMYSLIYYEQRSLRDRSTTR